MKRLILLFCCCAFLAGQLSAQLVYGQRNEDYTISIRNPSAPLPAEFRGNNFEQLPGFPKTAPNSTLKNFRNVTLADLNDDGVDDIIWATEKKIFAHTKDGLLWERDLAALAIYPPSVADIDMDGEPEIVLATGGPSSVAAPKLYAFEKDGTDIPGWPVSLNNNWILVAPVLSDVDGDGPMEIIVLERDFPIGYLHILRNDGASYSDDWPVALDATPAVTPSVGDVDGDGQFDIVVHSTQSRYVFDLQGNIKPGFPVTTGPTTRYSYQSPILKDFDGDGPLEIIGAAHWDQGLFFITNSDGAYRDGWPMPTTSTFTTPTVVEIEGEDWIFMSRPQTGDTPLDMLWAWDVGGNVKEGFPINQLLGSEGIISVGDVDGDGAFELVFPTNSFDSLSRRGFLCAYELDGTTPVEGFPIRPLGWNHLNGAALGDVNGDNLMDLIALGYTLNGGEAPDSVYLHAYNLNVPYSPERVLWSTYKGSNTRDGLLTPQVSTGATALNPMLKTPRAAPNPAKEETTLSFSLEEPLQASIHLTDALGRERQLLPARLWPAGPQQARLPLNNLPAGLYWISVRSTEKILGSTPVLIR
ncbi:MAG: VCBS repeat-containing protein [Lewinellaceae bacterium]|nr:VCBS repeat-containing protein [Phaeodactylibacter sp.]MCB9037347.1 VCBS repeat-containing protein [Lewinellaceae bacterium]